MDADGGEETGASSGEPEEREGAMTDAPMDALVDAFMDVVVAMPSSPERQAAAEKLADALAAASELGEARDRLALWTRLVQDTPSGISRAECVQGLARAKARVANAGAELERALGGVRAP